MDADVVVIGAGAAGLAAAAALGKRSLRVIVVEARDRVGGRVYSVPSSRRVAPAELGAEFIHGPAHETMALVRSAGSVAVETGGASFVSGDDGVLHESDDDIVSAGRILDEARSLPEDLSVNAYLRRFEADPSQRTVAQLARTFVEGFEAADPEIASVVSIAEEWHSGVDDFSARPVGGYPVVVDMLVAACAEAGVRVRLSCPVQKIAWHRGAVEVHAGDAVVRARAAIVTLPAGVLRHGDVAFEPALPDRKRSAIAKIEMGQVVKPVLRFRTAFWETLRGGRYRDAAFFRGSGGNFVTYWTLIPLHAELVVGWAGGPRAIALRGLSNDEIVQRALDGFGDLLGERALAEREFEEGLVHDWDGDPYARGAYSYVAVGGGDARARLGAPIDDTLFFAGEATSTDGQGGTVNGALETGERAAAQALRALAVAG